MGNSFWKNSCCPAFQVSAHLETKGAEGGEKSDGHEMKGTLRISEWTLQLRGEPVFCRGGFLGPQNGCFQK